MQKCRVCGRESVNTILDAGKHPIYNRFLTTADTEEYTHPLALGQCGACGTLLLVDPPPAIELRPRVDWITYNEPEGHLDQVVELLTGLPGINPSAGICGTSYKEDTTLARLSKRGFRRTWRIDPELDLGGTCQGAGIETIQDRLNPSAAKAIRERYGSADIVIARHILEHAQDISKFFEAIRLLLSPGGYAVFEVPDCTRVLDTLDFTTLWEEHVCYFTQATFEHCLASAGFSFVAVKCYPYPYENSLVAIVRAGGDAGVKPISSQVLELEKRRAERFARGLDPRRQTIRRFLREYRKSRGSVAVFGAGHLAGMFVNLMHVPDLVDVVVDDHPKKRGLLMPGSRIPIAGSDALNDPKIKLCLSSLSPESEEKVAQKQQWFVDAGGEFASIFPASKRALRIYSEDKENL